MKRATFLKKRRTARDRARKWSESTYGPTPRRSPRFSARKPKSKEIAGTTILNTQELAEQV